MKFHPIYLLLLITLMGCGGGQNRNPKADAISCTAAYRTDATQPLEAEQSYRLDSNNREFFAQFGETILTAQYQLGEVNQERAVVVFVSTTTGPATTQLYQLPQDNGPINQFVGGHGFTGLNYFTHPFNGSELQYWCSADFSAE